MQLEGIHHISAITGDAAGNVDFYARVLGLRLVAKTVNQDDPSVYHLFYASEHGRPGSDMTFFEYPGARRGRAGNGMVHRVVWRVGSSAALDFWVQRLAAEGITAQRATDDVTGRDSLVFEDPEGMGIGLVVADTTDAPLAAHHPEIPAEHALLGFEGVRAYTHDPERSRALLERLMGASEITRDGSAPTWELRGERRGGTITYDTAPTASMSIPGAGTVHHVAWGTTVEDHPAWFAQLQAAGVQSSPIIDRHYFKAIYYREPSGVLFELSDDEPGFTVDVPLEQLGEVVILPPQLEPHREQIVANLTPLPDPRASWVSPTA